MAEYIERQTVVDMLQNLSYDDWNQGVSTTWANAFSECAEMIRDIPPADVRPVRRGRWIVHYDDIWPTESTQECSECHEEVSLLIDCKFCPNCGAEMEVET